MIKSTGDRMALGLLCLLLFAPAGASAQARGTVKGEGWVRLRNGPGEQYDCVATVPGGSKVEVLEETDAWSLVESRSGVAFVKSAQLKVQAEETAALPQGADADVRIDGFGAPAMIRGKAGKRLAGTLCASEPILALEAEIYDERLLYVERIARLRFTAQQDVRTVALSSLHIPFTELRGGEKTLTLYVVTAGGRVQAAQTPFTVLGEALEPTHITGLCRVSAPGGRVDAMLDERASSCWTPEDAQEAVTVELPEAFQAGGMLVSWGRPTDGGRLVCLDADGNVLDRLNADAVYVNEWFDLDARTRRVQLYSVDNAPISQLRVYAKGRIPSAVQRWEPLAPKVDLMLFSAHQDDELLFFGGTIPYYADAGKEVAVVYMADCGRTRYAESLSGLWACGLRKHPLFLGLTDKRAKTFEVAKELWDAEGAIEKAVEVIRRYRPEVIVTHDIKGEYGHNQHKYTQSVVERATALAADPQQYPESAKAYGAWQVKKLYLHLLQDGEIRMDWTRPLPSQGGRTAIEMATIGYDKHISQQGYYSMNTGERYDNRAFGLRYSAVGMDAAKDDFFENL